MTTRWRVRPALPTLKLTGAVLLLVIAAVFATDAVALAVASVAAAGLVVWGFRDLFAPDRLVADETGLTVRTGFAGRRHIPWSAVERVAVDRRSHAGVSSETLEIDTGDALHVFSKHDLGAPPEDVATALEAMRG
ncbi:PH domain-containing protein [Asanoa sp. WMMD1127]|uniref:PH domain-containing protein n=1 Tax=Asanoa sp. WMMD1127 TaxID=3016107 RepID=UPI0024177A00|nr:PH domain-containing protein [Asanoa sp. WMMD1127]MDG4822041.1 PH domain-containing protein [Asanoa sp. WMMD1127]